MKSRLRIAGVSVLMLTGCAAAQAEDAASPRVTAAPAAPAARAETAAPAKASSVDQPAATATTTQPSAAAPPAVAPSGAAATAVEATATVAPERAIAGSLLDQFDAQLSALTRNEKPADAAFAALPADERAMLSTVIDSLARFRAALRDEPGLLAAKTAPMITLADQLNAQAPLSLPQVTLCKSVTQFGVYDPFAAARFPAGRETPTIVYVEVDHFRSDPNSAGQHETKLSYEAMLFADSDHATPIVTKKPARISDVCRNRRRDFFLADRLTLPATLPAGRYVLKVTVVDQLANRVAEKSLPIVVASE